jgi:membrane-associated phospholipid phosphatase
METSPPAPDRPLTHVVQNLGHDARRLPSNATLLVVGLGSVSAAIAHPSDASVADWASREGDAGYTRAGDVIGDAWTQAGAALATWGVGTLVHDARLAHVGADLIRGQALNGVITTSAKAIASRTRPNGGGRSFPSGHSSAAFTTAAILDEHFGWKAAVPAYAVASFVGWTRVRDDAHFVSDVIVGSAIGLAVGHTVARHHGDSAWTIAPSVSGHDVGIVVIRNR